MNGEWLLSLITTMLSLLAPSLSPLHVEVYGSYSESSRRSSKESNVLYMRPSVEAVPSLDAVDGGGSPLDTGFTLRRLTDRERVKSF